MLWIYDVYSVTDAVGLDGEPTGDFLEHDRGEPFAFGC